MLFSGTGSRRPSFPNGCWHAIGSNRRCQVPIVKAARGGAVAPNLRDYDAARRTFSWDAARRELDGLPGGRASTSPTRRSTATPPGPRRDQRGAPLARQERRGPRTSPTRDLARLTNRFANVLRGLGVAHGRPRLRARRPHPGALRRRARHAEEPAASSARSSRPSARSRSATRLAIGEARVLVTTEALYRRKVAAAARLAARTSSTCCSSATTGAPTASRAPHDYRRADGARRATSSTIGPTDPEDLALLHFTSGTTGTPEGRDPRPRGRRRPPHHRQARARSAPRRRLLVHRRPRLGDRHLLRHHRAAHERRDEHRRRGRLRRRALVPHPRRTSGSPSGTRRRRRSAC